MNIVRDYKKAISEINADDYCVYEMENCISDVGESLSLLINLADKYVNARQMIMAKIEELENSTYYPPHVKKQMLEQYEWFLGLFE